MSGFRVLMRWTLVALLGALVAAAGFAWLKEAGSSLPGRLARLDRMILADASILTVHPISRSGHTSSSGLPPGMVLGYFYDSPNDPQAVNFLRPYLSVLTGIIPFWYKIQANGTVSGQTNPAVLQVAERHHLWTFALVRNMAGASVFTPLLASPAARAQAINNMLTLVEVNGFDGVNLDFEGILPSDRHAFTNFVAQLAKTFHAHGYYVTLSVPAETANEPGNGWTGAYDYRALGRYADLLMIMAYDQHNVNSAPGPVAANSWVQQVLAYAISVVSPQKIILGVPGYGYEWSPAGNQALSWAQAKQLASQHNQSANRQGHFIYWQAGQLHSVWFENTQTFLSKVKLVVGFELRGIALWRLGIEDPKIWNFLQ